SVQLDVMYFRQPVFQLPVQGVNPVLNPLPADRFVELESLVKGPSVFEGVESAGRHRTSSRHRLGWTNFRPHSVRLTLERRNGRCSCGPGTGTSPTLIPYRAAERFMTPGNEGESSAPIPAPSIASTRLSSRMTPRPCC